MMNKIDNAIVPDPKLFEYILSVVDMSYEIKDRKIVLKESNGDYYSTHDGEIMYFENTIDAMNSIDWKFDA